MRAINLNTSTYIDLLAQESPFLIGSTVVVQGANGVTVISASDDSGTDSSVIATLTTAAPFQTVVLNNRYLKSGTGPASILNN